MATVTAPLARPLEDRFFVVMAGLCAVIAFTGFAQTYWLQVPAGTFTGSPLLHLHGLLFSVWTLFFLSQATFIATGRYLDHRAWGLAGIALATAMLFTGTMVAVAGLQHRIEQGYGDAGRAFLIVPGSAMLLFAGFIAAAIVNRRRSDWHKRFMLIATVSLLNAPIARFFFLAATGGGPGMRPGMGPPRPVEFGLMPALLGDLIIVLAMLFDWRTRGRPHPAYVWGLGVLLAVQFLRAPISRTDSWLAFADYLARFSG
jgi:hypothetical protein